jgi:hypothetical protein
MLLSGLHIIHSRSAAQPNENGKVSHLADSIHVGTCPHQHLRNLVVTMAGSAVKGRPTELQSQGQSDSVSAVAYTSFTVTVQRSETTVGIRPK